MSFYTEDEILLYWDSINAFEEQDRRADPNKPFILYEGPPFATGKPHLGSLLTAIIKDTITRYHAQNGKLVSRRHGLDCHGLPIEFEIEKALGIKTKEQIQQMGINNYNNECRKIVFRCLEDWKQTTRRVGRWIDMEKTAYRTLDPKFMESGWNILKRLHQKGLVYKGFKVMPYSPSLHTVLSNFEAKMDYRDIDDPSLTIKFKLIGTNKSNALYQISNDVSVLVWTTTPWTLPSNLMIGVHPEIQYSLILDESSNQHLLLASNRISNYYLKNSNSKMTLIKTFSGQELLDMNLEYFPIFDLFKNKDYPNDKIYRLVQASFVKDDVGTGFVHLAPAFGADDYKLAVELGIITKTQEPPSTFNSEGCLELPKSVIKDISEREILPDTINQLVKLNNYKPSFKETDGQIITILKNNNYVFKSTHEKHQYPFCWRSKKPLMYKAVESWFINIEKIKDQLIENNQKINWIPETIGKHKMGQWIQETVDWCFDRSRYWGNPIPIWMSDDGEEIVIVGSIRELEELANLPPNTITDLHREFIDLITIPSKMGKGQLKRIESVFDCWFESGSMPYGQDHYPFEGQTEPPLIADFIAEGADQTRGWFYTLNVLSTALEGRPAFKNVVVNGLVLDENGDKISKSKGNYTDTLELIEKYGADVIRFYMLQSPVVVAENLKYQPSKIEEKGEVASMFHQIKNMVLYFIESKDVYLNKFKKETFQTLNIEDVKKSKYRSYLDTWILQELDYYLNRVHKAYTTFNLRSLGQITIDLIISLSKNYIKFNKLRFKSDDEEEVKYMLSILWNALDYLILGMSPMTPFTSEAIYQKIRLYDNKLNTTEYNSIHWRHIPQTIEMENGKEDWIKIVKKFLKAIDIVRIIRTEQLRIETRKPLQKIFLGLESNEMVDGFKKLEKYFLNELNILNIEFFVLDESYLELKTNVNRKIYGPILGKKMKDLEKLLSSLDMFEIIKNKSNITFENISIPFTDLEISYNPHSKLGKTKETKWLIDYSYQFNDGLLIVIDTKTTPEIELMYQGRTLSRQIQDMRKTLNLKSSNPIKIFMLEEKNNVPEFITKQDKYLVPYLGQSIDVVSVIPKNTTYLGRLTCFDIMFYLYTN